MTGFIKTAITDIEALLDKVKADLESDFTKAETFFAPIIKEVLVAFSHFGAQDLAAIAETAAAAFVPGADEALIGANVLAEVTKLVKAQAPQLGAIAIQGLSSNLAALGKQSAAANPVNNTNG